MNSDRKLVGTFRFGLVCLLSSTLACWSVGYLFVSVNSGIMELRACFTIALINAAFFFSSFAAYRLHIRFNQFKRELSERRGLGDTSPSKELMKGEARRLKKYGIVVTSLVVFAIFNGFLLHKACSSNNHTRVFLHMVAFVVACFAFCASSLIHNVNETFKKIEGLVSQRRKDQDIPEIAK